MSQYLEGFQNELKKISNRLFSYSIRTEGDQYYIFEIKAISENEVGDQVAIPYKMVTDPEHVKLFTKNVIQLLTKRFSESLIIVEGETKIQRKVIKV